MVANAAVCLLPEEHYSAVISVAVRGWYQDTFSLALAPELSRLVAAVFCGILNAICCLAVMNHAAAAR
jgi:hypothetical protein